MFHLNRSTGRITIARLVKKKLRETLINKSSSDDFDKSPEKGRIFSRSERPTRKNKHLLLPKSPECFRRTLLCLCIIFAVSGSTFSGSRYPILFAQNGTPILFPRLGWDV